MRIFENPPRYFGPLALLALSAVAGFAGTAIANSNQAKPQNTNPNPTPIGTQIVDPMSGKANNPNNLGRAALIATSPQGVQGTDTSSRYKLLGNISGLGN